MLELLNVTYNEIFSNYNPYTQYNIDYSEAYSGEIISTIEYIDLNIVKTSILNTFKFLEKIKREYVLQNTIKLINKDYKVLTDAEHYKTASVNIINDIYLNNRYKEVNRKNKNIIYNRAKYYIYRKEYDTNVNILYNVYFDKIINTNINKITNLTLKIGKYKDTNVNNLIMIESENTVIKDLNINKLYTYIKNEYSLYDDNKTHFLTKNINRQTMKRKYLFAEELNNLKLYNKHINAYNNRNLSDLRYFKNTIIEKDKYRNTDKNIVINVNTDEKILNNLYIYNKNINKGSSNKLNINNYEAFDNDTKELYLKNSVYILNNNLNKELNVNTINELYKFNNKLNIKQNDFAYKDYLKGKKETARNEFKSLSIDNAILNIYKTYNLHKILKFEKDNSTSKIMSLRTRNKGLKINDILTLKENISKELLKADMYSWFKDTKDTFINNNITLYKDKLSLITNNSLLSMSKNKYDISIYAYFGEAIKDNAVVNIEDIYFLNKDLYNAFLKNIYKLDIDLKNLYSINHKMLNKDLNFIKIKNIDFIYNGIELLKNKANVDIFNNNKSLEKNIINTSYIKNIVLSGKEKDTDTDLFIVTIDSNNKYLYSNKKETIISKMNKDLSFEKYNVLLDTYSKQVFYIDYLMVDSVIKDIYYNSKNINIDSKTKDIAHDDYSVNVSNITQDITVNNTDISIDNISQDINYYKSDINIDSISNDAKINHTEIYINSIIKDTSIDKIYINVASVLKDTYINKININLSSVIKDTSIDNISVNLSDIIKDIYTKQYSYHLDKQKYVNYFINHSFLNKVVYTKIDNIYEELDIKRTIQEYNTLINSVKVEQIINIDNNQFLIDKIIKDTNYNNSLLLTKDYIDVRNTKYYKLLEDKNFKDIMIDANEWVYYEDYYKPFDLDARGIDELLLPQEDFNYSVFKDKLIDENTLQPINPVRVIDDITFIAKYPTNHPIPKLKNIAKEYIGVPVTLMNHLFHITSKIWQKNLFKFGGMDMKDATNLLIEYVDGYIHFYIPESLKKQAYRVLKMIRWYAETSIIRNSEYKVKILFEPLESELYTGVCKIPNVMDNMHIDNNMYTITNTNINQPCSVEFKINNPVNTKIKFYINMNKGKAEIYLNNVLIDEVQVTSANLEYDLPKQQGSENVIKIFYNSQDNGIINISNVVVNDMVYSDIITEYSPKIGSGNKVLDELIQRLTIYSDVINNNQLTIEDVINGNLAITDLIDKLNEYFELHHVNKEKGKRLTIKK